MVNPLLSFLRAALWLVAAFSVFGFQAHAQTCAVPGWDGPATPTGVINSYHGGNGTASAGSSQVTVASATGLRTSNRALRAGDLVLIMQMQDATTPANAGLHEYAQIISLTGNVLTLNRTLTNTYVQNVAANLVRTFQVVFVPQYSQATLSGAVTADRWTMAAASGVVSGGVVAMDVAGSLALTGSIDVSGAGFRGGAGVNGTGSRVGGLFNDGNYVFVPGAANGAIKGEGTTGTPIQVFDGTATPVNYAALLTQGYAAGAAGQAAQGNAGGGGNDGEPIAGGNQYNSGGGGGSNGGAGGKGGFSWSQQNDAGGRGAAALATTVARVVLGGGGGSGASNNNGAANAITAWPPTDNATTRPVPPALGTANGANGVISVSGASGGGIVLIRTGSLTGGGSISANGYTAYNVSGAASSEGGGAGGAGGSVVVLVGNATSGALTINANGGKGGYSNYYDHGPGGGGGGMVIRNFVTGTVNNAGGGQGYDGCCGGVQGNASPKFYNAVAGSVGTSVTTGGSAIGVQGGASCLPAINVTKSTSTPSINTAIGATASYTINLSNTGGAASNVFMIDATLPPGWQYTAATAPTFSNNSSLTLAVGAETVSAAAPGPLPVASVTSANSATAVSLRAAASAPGVTPTTGNNTVTFGSFYLPQNGSITVSFVATIPNTATVGVYHNPAGVIFLDPTRTTTAVRMVSPLANVTANRDALPYSPNPANTSYASGATVNVAGSNYSGLEAGPALDNVTLLPDLSVTKTINTPTFTVGATPLSYIVTGRNNGRPIADQVYANTQATGQSATSIVSATPSVIDTLPTGMTLTAITNSATPTWACTPNGTSTTFTCSAGGAGYPMAAATNLFTATATVAVSAASCPGPQINSATMTTPAIGDALPSNNVGTVSTPIDCNVNLSVTKTNGTTTVTSGSTTSYTVTFTNSGPAAANGALVRDIPSSGLSCTVLSCTDAGTNACAGIGPLSGLLGSGLTLASFASGATAAFQVRCDVTATGQ